MAIKKKTGSSANRPLLPPREKAGEKTRVSPSITNTKINVREIREDEFGIARVAIDAIGYHPFASTGSPDDPTPSRAKSVIGSFLFFRRVANR